MKTVLLSSLILGSSILALNAFASESSPAGEAVICNYPHSVTPLDLFQNGNDPELGDASVSYPDKVRLVAERVNERDEVFAKLLLRGLREFRVGHLPEPDTQSGGHELHRCRIAPVDQALWKEMTSDNKTAVVLHTILFEAAGPNANSQALSKLVDLLVTDQLDALSFDDYVSLMLGAQVTDRIRTSIQGYVLENSLEQIVNPNGTICGEYVGGSSTIQVAGEEAVLSSDPRNRSSLCFYSEGPLAYVKALNPAEVANSGNPMVYAIPKNYVFTVSSRKVRFSIEAGISLYPNGNLRSGVALDAVERIPAGTRIYLNKDGEITK